jgi:hypothetical protein
MVRRTGTGLWQSAQALGKLQRRYLDAESGQAGAAFHDPDYLIAHAQASAWFRKASGFRAPK